MKPELTADDYSYLLPDHWILHDRDQDGVFTRLHAHYVNRVVRFIQQSGAKTVLEVGCGDGWACGQMVSAGLDVVGIDWSSKAIKYANVLVPSARFIRADVRDEEFLGRFPDKFDAVALIEVIEHIPPAECVAAVRSITACLKPGGVFVLTTPSTNFPNDNPQHYRHFTEGMLRDIAAESNGLRVLSVEGYGDIVAERSYYRRARWFNNRYYEIKPLHRLLLRRYHDQTILGPTPLDRSHGLIMTMRREVSA